MLGAIGDDGFGCELRARALRARYPSPNLADRAARRRRLSPTPSSSTQTTGEEDQPPRRFHQHRAAARRSRAADDRKPLRRDVADAFDVIIVSDQAETETRRRGHARRARLLSTQAPHSIRRRSSGSIRGCAPSSSATSIVKPNDARGRGSLPRASSATWITRRLRRHVHALRLLIVTQGDQGALRLRRQIATDSVPTRPGRSRWISAAPATASPPARPARSPSPAPARSRAVRQPGGVHHDHEERNRHGLSRGTAGLTELAQ